MTHFSIFEGVVRSEDAYTNLLRNMMLADPEYRKAIGNLLRPNGLDISSDQSADIKTQVLLRAADVVHGRGDLLIETRTAVLLVEVKTDLYCGLTDNQHFGLDDNGNPKIKGYLQYLEQKRLGGSKVGLCVLAPPSLDLSRRNRRASETMRDPRSFGYMGSALRTHNEFAVHRYRQRIRNFPGERLYEYFIRSR